MWTHFGCPVSNNSVADFALPTLRQQCPSARPGAGSWVVAMTSPDRRLPSATIGYHRGSANHFSDSDSLTPWSWVVNCVLGHLGRSVRRRGAHFHIHTLYPVFQTRSHSGRSFLDDAKGHSTIGFRNLIFGDARNVANQKVMLCLFGSVDHN